MPVNFIYTAWLIFQAIVAVIIVFPIFSYFFYILIRQKPSKKDTHPKSEGDYAILVTAYKDTANIPFVVNSLLSQHFTNFIIYIIADNCKGFKDNFLDERVVVLQPEEVLQNQLKSHFYAIGHFKRNHNRLIIIDSDNLVDPAFLTNIDKLFDAGYSAVQGVRKAKNLNTAYACLDAANEIYYFFFNRKILFNIGSSSMLSGSGMAFTVSLYKECLAHVQDSGAGFDKILQKEIISKGYRIAFAEDAVVYDEKTAHRDQLVKQRARWNNTWFRYFNFGLQLMWQGITQLNFNRFVFGFIIIRPPLFLLLGLSVTLLFANIFININIAFAWVIVLLSFTAGFFIALTKSNTDKRIYQALVHIPKFVFLQVLSLFKTRKANQFSVATIHVHREENNNS